MPLYKPITMTRELLPRVGEAFETSTFDMKRSIYPVDDGKGGKKLDQFELAKDVAMFAGSLGGTILVGAKEHGTAGTLEDYFPMTLEEAKKLADAFDGAVKDRCRPRPMINCDTIKISYDDSAGVVLAVNVDPFPGQAVAVRVRADKTDGYGADAYVFPLRVGRSCSFIPPEQLPMLMLPALRHTVIRLRQIPEQGANAFLRGSNGQGYTYAAYKIHEAGSTVDFETSSGTVNIPLDFIGPVWPDQLGQWIVQLNGRLTGGGNISVVQFQPA